MYVLHHSIHIDISIDVYVYIYIHIYIYVYIHTYIYLFVESQIRTYSPAGAESGSAGTEPGRSRPGSGGRLKAGLRVQGLTFRFDLQTA